MAKHKMLRGAVAKIFIGVVCALISSDDGSAQPVQTLHIDVPVMLQKADVVMDIGHAVYNGDALFVMGDLNVLVNDYTNWKTNGKIVAVLHGDAAYLVLNNETYDAVRHVTTGNPYGALIAQWLGRGVQIELCGATARGNHWVNADLLPGIKINSDAMSRVTQLEQQGYTLIYQ